VSSATEREKEKSQGRGAGRKRKLKKRGAGEIFAGGDSMKKKAAWKDTVSPKKRGKKPEGNPRKEGNFSWK